MYFVDFLCNNVGTQKFTYYKVRMLVSGLCKHIFCIESRLNITSERPSIRTVTFLFKNMDTEAETLFCCIFLAIVVPTGLDACLAFPSALLFVYVNLFFPESLEGLIVFVRQ